MVGYSQKGVGEKTGLSRQTVTPELIDLRGTVQNVENGPCKYTTGKSISGTHLLLKTTDDKLLNVHLGPTSEVSKYVGNLVGKEIEIKAFRTKKLPHDHYIAKELSNDGKNSVLRDETLRPIWAGRQARGRKG